MSKRNGPRPRPVIERLLARVEVDPDAGCWLFMGAKSQGGYGQIGIGSATNGTDGHAPAHRVAYAEMVGEIPEGMVLDHLCRVRHCVNPDHLEPVTFAENVRRGLAGKHGFNTRKTHCPHGHPYDAENTRISPSGRRCCRACARRLALRTYYADRAAGKPRRKAGK